MLRDREYRPVRLVAKDADRTRSYEYYPNNRLASILRSMIDACLTIT